ncbi:hypothetical protein J2129_001682 [Methanofollis sp. W23]|nr:hypothetical protein [Methanofollis sp. W23]
MNLLTSPPLISGNVSGPWRDERVPPYLEVPQKRIVLMSMPGGPGNADRCMDGTPLREERVEEEGEAS